MLNKYKKWRRNVYENRLREFIKFNLKKIEEYESEVDIDTIVSNNSAICRNYDKGYLNKLQQKYGINKDLINKAISTEDEALEKYCQKREKELQLKKTEQERKEIDLYKKAILELKKENKI